MQKATVLCGERESIIAKRKDLRYYNRQFFREPPSTRE